MTALARNLIGVDGEANGASAEARGIQLLRQISEAGGRVTPTPNPEAFRGYAYSGLADGVENDLMALTKRGYLDARFLDRVTLCPKCSSHHLNVREICPGCRSSHLSSEGLIHHFRCGNIGLPSEYTLNEDGSYLCPKCNRRMYHLGTEYDRLGKAFVCRACARISDNPPLEAVCLCCGQRTPGDDLISSEVFTYVLNSRGWTAMRCGSLSDNGNSEPVSIEGASVYRRTIILEFLGHELKRMERFNRGFSVLLVECTAINDSSIDIAKWLRRLRECLHEVDLIGQLADALYVVVLPQTKLREAEALCQSIGAKLGPRSPLAITPIEIAEPMDLAAILTRRTQKRQ